MRLIVDTKELERFAERLTRQDKGLKQATKEIAQLLKDMMKVRTPVETGRLRAGWDEQSGIRVQEVAGGFEVQLVNPVFYATWVNDGHRVRNMPDGPYLKVRNRVKVPVARQWQEDTSDWYVYGHFFVEASILSMENNKYIEKLIMENLERWLGWCCGD